MQRLPIGIQTFSELVDPAENYVYVDKTAVLHDLVTAGKYYFLSRPRRFGKSVLLSTLYELFAANKPLFSGLYIEDKWNWELRYPVIRISFGGGLYDTDENFLRQLSRIMGDNEERLSIDCIHDKTQDTTDFTTCFHDLIKKSFQQYQQKVVILIDEYDKPILDNITNKEVQLSLNGLFIDYLTNQKYDKTALQDRLYDNLEAGDVAAFQESLSTLFAGIPYQNYANKIIEKYEGYYASVVYAYLASLGIPLIAEDVTNRGRIDLSILLSNRVYIIEFKVDQPGRALEQVRKKKYHEKYQNPGCQIYLIGISFDSTEKNITEFEWEIVK